jgi:hypothetical protein
MPAMKQKKYLKVNKEVIMKIFHDFDVYDYKYTYDHLKVMCEIGSFCNEYQISFDYEDLCRIAEAIYAHWIDGRTADEDEKYAMYPWLEFETIEEDGYIQAYTARVLPEFIKLYCEEVLHV